MDVRENLTEIIFDSLCRHIDKSCKLAENIADDILGSGVTVQEWVSVNDRLPQNFVSVLGYITDAGEFPPVRECYTVGNAFFFPALGDVHPVSHWCEMPEPPKGE